MPLAAVHLSPAISIPLALALAAGLAWYWIALGRSDVPVSRRKIRRFSLIVIALSMPMLVRAVSFLDPEVDKRPYVVTWAMVIFMLLMVIACALMDAINNLRLHETHRQDAIAQAATDLALAIRERREQARLNRRRETASGVTAAADDSSDASAQERSA